MNYKFNVCGKNEIYIIMIDGTDRTIKKVCCSVKCRDTDIVIMPGYSKTYLKDQHCKLVCKNKENCSKKWNNSCFDKVNEDFEYGMFHTTRHNGSC